MPSTKTEYIIILAIIFLIFALIYIRYSRKNTTLESNQKLGIQELVSEVKSELDSLGRKRFDSNNLPLFEVKQFELEINFVVKEKQVSEGKFSYEVVTVGTNTELSNEKIQKIKLLMSTIPSEADSIKAEEKLEVSEEKVILIGSKPPKE